MKEIVLITGSSSGVGLESAIQYAQRGYKVYATMRNLEKATTLQNRLAEEKLDIHILPLDVQDTASVHSAVDTIIANDGKIDILLNNAGAGYARTLEGATEEDIHWVTDVNYLGVIRCTKAVLPYMREAKKGRIITVTSVGGLVGFPFNELYCGAKFAVEGFIESMATYITPAFGIRFSLIEPGGISTEFMKSAMAATTYNNGQMNPASYDEIFAKYMNGIKKRLETATMKAYQTPIEVAEVICNITEMENPPLRTRTSQWSEETCSLKTDTDPDGLRINAMVRKEYLQE